MQAGEAVKVLPRAAVAGHRLTVARIGSEPLQELVLFGGREAAVLAHHPGGGDIRRIAILRRRRFHRWGGGASPWRWKYSAHLRMPMVPCTSTVFSEMPSFCAISFCDRP